MSEKMIKRVRKEVEKRTKRDFSRMLELCRELPLRGRIKVALKVLWVR